LTGFLVGGSFYADLDILNLSLPSDQLDRPLPPGRGYFARRTRYRALQTASCHAGTPGLMEWIKGISQKKQAAVSR
jgi:hypothetical protein